MIILQRQPDSSYSLHFILWSDSYPHGKDSISTGGWSRKPLTTSKRLSFKLEIIK